MNTLPKVFLSVFIALFIGAWPSGLVWGATAFVYLVASSLVFFGAYLIAVLWEFA